MKKIMDRKIVYLKFKSPIHLGSDIQGIGKESIIDFIHSDTIFSTFVNNVSLLYKSDSSKIENFISDFSKYFRLSSAFPFKNDSGRMKHFFKKPLINPPNFYNDVNDNDIESVRFHKKSFGKDLKKIDFIQLRFFLDWICGKNLNFKDLFNNKVKFFVEETVPHNYQDRLTKATGIYYTGLIFFEDNCGLYFIMEKDENSSISWELIKNILQITSVNGFGGRKTYGKGKFEFELKDLPEEINLLFNEEDRNAYLILSLFYPSDEDKNFCNPISYDIVPRKGWFLSFVTNKQMKRKSCSMFSEFSVFKNKPRGCLLDVTPKQFDLHKIYRYGIPLCIPIKVFEN